MGGVRMVEEKMFWVTYKVDGRYCAEVKAKDIKEALAKAEDEYMSADFGELETVDEEPVTIEDEKGNVVEINIREVK